MPGRFITAAAVLLVASCDNAADALGGDVGADDAAAPQTRESEASPEPEPMVAPAGDRAGDGVDDPLEPPPRAKIVTPSLPEPLELRKTGHAVMVYPEPASSADFRGKLPHGESFAVYEHAEGPNCDGPWGRVAIAGYVCLDDTSITTEAPVTLPRIPGDRLVPFWYAKTKDPDDPAPVWRSSKSMRDGADPIGTLDKDHVYSFAWKRGRGGSGYFSDSTHRTVAAKDVKHLDPSDFTGRDVATLPVPEDKVLAWTVHWPYTNVYEVANEESTVLRKLEYHAELYILDTPTRRGNIDYYRTAEGDGWVSAKETRHWIPLGPPPEGVDDDEAWLDIELTQQTLTVMRGADPQFVTLVSSGSHKDPTPTGLYRIEGKMALSDMRSRDGDDEAYHVEDVPWVMYFKGRYALHGAYWHNRFGRRTSHGCINLSAIDARKVFDLTAPHAPPGWIMVFEHEDDPGTMIRIRKLQAHPKDLRTPLG